MKEGEENQEDEQDHEDHEDHPLLHHLHLYHHHRYHRQRHRHRHDHDDDEKVAEQEEEDKDEKDGNAMYLSCYQEYHCFLCSAGASTTWSLAPTSRPESVGLVSLVPPLAPRRLLAPTAKCESWKYVYYREHQHIPKTKHPPALVLLRQAAIMFQVALKFLSTQMNIGAKIAEERK